jgi:hypothetical protein
MLVCALALVAAHSSAARAPRLAAYSGTGTWVSIYDTAAWRNPERVVARLHTRHIHTLYLQTSNDRQDTAIRHRAGVARFLDAAHAVGIRVVGWYLPSFANNRRDLSRILAGAAFASANGQHFDSFALDVESTKVRSIRLRTRRAVRLVAAVRRALPKPYVLGAITIDPVGARYWPRYPFRQLAAKVDVFLPMAYFTARTSGARKVGAYSRANVERVRSLAGDASFPVHPIGGDARHATLAEVRAFLRAAASTRALGVSIWEYGGTTPSQWALLTGV